MNQFTIKERGNHGRKAGSDGGRHLREALERESHPERRTQEKKRGNGKQSTARE